VRYITDLHIHSPYSRATSKTSHLFGLASWAAVKGIRVIGTGDFTHPEWLNHLVTNLEEAEPGFFRLREKRSEEFGEILPQGLQAPDISGIRFVLTSEISSIYKRGGKVRKVHNIVFSPDFESVRLLNATLAGIGNIESDGRPILGLDSRDLLEIVLEKVPEGFLVPAHIWTPWFSLFGSKSGFDAIGECFADLAEHVFALETGLSSDPDMNRRVSALDRFTLISNSDCHSPGKLGREANVFNTDFDYFSMRQAIRTPRDASGRQLFEATIEFYPEEGKYHCDGHRKCGVCMEPSETEKAGGICPACGRPVTVGVLNRVMELADRSFPVYPAGSPAVHSLVPLAEVLGELLDAGPATKKVTAAYIQLVQQFGSEYGLLLQAPPEEIDSQASPVLAEAVRRIRSGRVVRKPGFDGEFGVVRVFAEGEKSDFAGQGSLFSNARPATRRRPERVFEDKRRRPKRTAADKPCRDHHLNPEQQRAVASDAGHIIVQAGPGTGKTHTLVKRAVRIAGEKKRHCTVITFTNKAADELQERLRTELGPDMAVRVATLHGFCLQWLRSERPGLRVAGPEERRRHLKGISRETGINPEELDRRATAFLQTAPGPDLPPPPELASYFRELSLEAAIDIEAVVPETIRLLRENEPVSEAMRRDTGDLFIDEFQDLNRSQYELVLLLAATSPVFAIGDPDQAIYGFRGASPEWFGRFIEDLQPEQHALYRNYRSTQDITDSAFAVICRNQRIVQPVRPHPAAKEDGEILIYASSNPRTEAQYILGSIESMLGGSSHREIERVKAGSGREFSLSDMAVLYRTRRQADILADVFGRHGFPVQVVDITPFYGSGPARLLYLWMLAASGEAGSSEILEILAREERAAKKDIQALELALPAGMDNTLDRLPELERECSEPLFRHLLELADFAAELKRTAGQGLDAAVNRVLARNAMDAEDRDVVRFFRLAENFGAAVGPFAVHLRRYSDSVVYDDRAEAVTLMTIHAAKGLEFPVVFLVGLEEGMLPLAPGNDLTPAEAVLHLEEERRLFYVGMTRAEKILSLSWCENRQAKGEVIQQKQSRFIAEIPAGFLVPAEKAAGRGKKIKPRARQLNLF
jgi:uncharacterized protein (TIGR00375 family)